MVYILHVVCIQGAMMGQNCGKKSLDKQTVQNHVIAFVVLSPLINTALSFGYLFGSTTTLSPGLRCLTSRPTDVTTPLNSCPKITGISRHGNVP
jgi:hypothetical protein